MDEPIAGFDWDAGNLEHCRKHGVSRLEIESVFSGPVILLPDMAHSQTEHRSRAIGKTGGGRHVFVVFTIRQRGGNRAIRPVSARYMHQEEIKGYEEDTPGL